MKEFEKSLRKNSESKHRLYSFADYDKNLILNESQNKMISAYIIIGCVSLTLALAFVMMKYNDKLLAFLIILGISCICLSLKVVLNIIVQHDTIMIINAQREQELQENLEKIKKAKEENKQNLYIQKHLEAFKEEIHKSALER
jgi:membrane protein insertase Oxa1/YidC/SpoIIIJ